MTVLHVFTYDDGYRSLCKLVLAKDGSLYGTTYGGGVNETGTIFRLTIYHVHTQFAAPVYPVDERAATATLAVARLGTSTGAISVHFATADGTALAGRDYRAAAGTLAWADGDVSPKPITVALLDPGFQYGSSTRTFSVSLSAPTGGSNVGTPGTASVVIAGTTNPPVFTSAPTASADVGTPFSYQITAANGAATYGVSGLPGGLSVNAHTGLISGTPKFAGVSTLTLHAYNAGGKGSATLTLTVTD